MGRKFVAVVELDGAYNVRDLGGLRTLGGGLTKSGAIYRGDSLDHISHDDETVLFDRLGIRAVIDLRTSTEAGSPGWLRRPVSYLRYPLIDDGRLGREPLPSDNPRELARVYLNNASDGARAIKDIFTALRQYLRQNVPCIFHCAAGRDRTGIISALLLDLVGVRQADIAADYVQSNRHARQVTRRLAENPLYSNNSVPPSEVILLDRESILSFLRLIADERGGSAQFLESCGLKPGDLGDIARDFVVHELFGQLPRVPLPALS
jgi:protein-tyrosine phosphatase